MGRHGSPKPQRTIQLRRGVKITVFKNIWDVSEPMYTDVLAIFKRIREGGSKKLIESIRSEKDPKTQASLKMRLPSILFSGRFSQRNSQYLLEHSGLICLDIDYVNAKDMKKISSIIQDDVHTFGSFISPRGKGFKIIVKIPDEQARHKGLFRALEKHWNVLLEEFTSFQKNEKELNGKIVKIDESQGDFLIVHIDKSGKDISRVCYESYDPNIYYNQDSEIWPEVLEELETEINIKDHKRIIDKLQIWIDERESYSQGNRNNYLSKFMYATNRFGVPDSVVSDYLVNKFHGLPAADLKSMLKSCYSKTHEFGTQFFTEKELSKNTNVVKIEESKQITEFWTINDRGRVKIDTKQLLRFIEANGYGIYRQKEDVKSWDFVLIKNMIVDVVDIMDIKRDVLDYVDKNAPVPVFDELQMKNRYFEKTFLNALKVVEVDQIKDKKDKSFIFFDGFYYEITAKEIKKCDYIDLKGVHIWRSQLCRETITEIVDYDNHDFCKFLVSAMQSNDKFHSACTVLGYGIHTYKKQRLAKLMYCCEESHGELDGGMEGGSGKNLYQKALGYVRSVVEIDGKSFDKRDRFNFQQIRDDTQIVIIDDYESDVKELFTKITGGFAVERKALHKKMIPFENSPKLFVSSNQAPKGFSASYARRLHVLEFSSFYNENHTPADDFGDKDFFSDDWNQADYNALYSFLFVCVQAYLKHGIKDLDYKNLKAKQLVLNVGRDFSEYWMAKDAPDLSDWTYGRQLREVYQGEMQGSLSDQEFYGKMRKLCKLNNWKYLYKGVGAIRKIKVIKNQK